MTRGKRDIRVWALPVRPDLLLGQLAAYDQILPQLTSFRLCHAFGNGLDVHVNKLPVELRVAIGDLIIDSRLKKGCLDEPGCHWGLKFRCFEDRCRPRYHTQYGDDAELDWEEEIWDEMTHCEACAAREEDWHWTACDQCQRKHARHLDIDTLRHDKLWEKRHWEDADRWTELVTAITARKRIHYESWFEEGPEGRYNKPIEVLHRYFGLHAEPKNIKEPKWTLEEDPTSDTWIETPNRIWRRSQKSCQTTLCFLTLSQQPAAKKTTQTKGKQAVDDKHAHDQDDIPRRFRHALTVLGLEPYLHPHQALLLNPEHSDSEDAQASKTAPGPEEQWPRLLKILRSGAVL